MVAEPVRRLGPRFAIDGDDDAVHQYTGYTAGAWTYSAWVYVPMEMDTIQYFILLNTYPSVFPDGWSLGLELRGGTDVVRDLDGGATLPLIRDEWTEIRVEIDLDADRQRVFYNDTHLVTKAWTSGPGEGVANIAAVDLWGAGSEHAVYYDGLTLVESQANTCPADLDGSGAVGFTDLLAILGAWGDCSGCPEDLDGDGFVAFGDILIVLSAWGSCP